MAIDQALLECGHSCPILRIYEWSEPTISFGYFYSLLEVQELIPSDSGEGLSYIRRCTGGGVVDHRLDITYTLVIPRSQSLAQKRGVESYCLIHQALAEALRKMGEDVEVNGIDEGVSEDDVRVCFANPVPYDLCDLAGKKIAGAGQKRSRYGLLHQGSVIPSRDSSLYKQKLPQLLGSCLANRSISFYPDGVIFERALVLCKKRYSTKEWMEKR